MSLQHHFAARARAEGLIVPAGTSGVGPALASSSEYRAVEAAGGIRRGRRDGFLRGRSMGSLRLDSASKNPQADAEMLARAAEWSEFFAAKFAASGAASRMDAKDVAAIGWQTALSFVHQLHGTPGARFDATVPMASQGLTYILPEVYKIQHNDLPCWEGNFLDIWTAVDPAANDYAWYEVDNVGTARASNTYDLTTIPMVNGPIASDNKGLIVPALCGMEMNFMDPRREALAVSMGKPDFNVEAMKRQGCERVLAEFFDALWFGGDKILGIDGLMNHPVVETLLIAGGTWASKSALQIFEDLKTIVWAIANRTAGALNDLSKVEIKLPPTQYQSLMQPMTAAGTQSILAYFRQFFSEDEKSNGVPKVTQEFRLAAANSQAYNGGPNILAEDTGLVLYRDGNTLANPKFVLSQPIEVPAPVRQTGLGDVTYFHARGGGMMLPDARRIKYIVGF